MYRQKYHSKITLILSIWYQFWIFLYPLYNPYYRIIQTYIINHLDLLSIISILHTGEACLDRQTSALVVWVLVVLWHLAPLLYSIIYHTHHFPPLWYVSFYIHISETLHFVPEFSLSNKYLNTPIKKSFITTKILVLVFWIRLMSSINNVAIDIKNGEELSGNFIIRSITAYNIILVINILIYNIDTTHPLIATIYK